MNRYIQYMYSYPHKTAYRALENVNLRDYFFNLEGEGHSLYLHLPFCESKCGYCNLFSVTGCGRSRMDAYIDAVLRQVRQYQEMMPRSTSFDDLTIGGGTPLLLESGQIERIFETVKANLPMSGSCKIIIETAPNQTDQEKVELLKKLGVTRVSMGIQSFDNGELRWLGRNHDSRRAGEAAGLLRDAGFECVNFDFIYGLPGQTAESLTRSLEMALSFSPDEIFLYPLYIKHGVRLEREGRKGLLDPEHMYALYRCGSEYLRENGYMQISMRRFIKRGFGETTSADGLRKNVLPDNLDCENVLQRKECRGDILQEGIFPEFSECGLKSALSLGCGGRSYLGRLHTCTPYRTTRNAALEEIERYQRTEDFSSVSNGILLSDEELKRRYVIKHLLILPGISRQAYKRAFQADVLEDFPIIKDWIGQGWLEERCGNAGCDALDRDGRAHGNGNGDVLDRAGRNNGNGNGDALDYDGRAYSVNDHNYIGLTTEGLGLSDYIGPQLISEDIMGRMLEWERANA